MAEEDSERKIEKIYEHLQAYEKRIESIERSLVPDYREKTAHAEHKVASLSISIKRLMKSVLSRSYNFALFCALLIGIFIAYFALFDVTALKIPFVGSNQSDFYYRLVLSAYFSVMLSFTIMSAYISKNDGMQSRPNGTSTALIGGAGAAVSSGIGAGASVASSSVGSTVGSVCGAMFAPSAASLGGSAGASVASSGIGALFGNFAGLGLIAFAVIISFFGMKKGLR